MADTHSIDLKLKRLHVIEADYRAAIRRAEEDYEKDFITREKLLKIKKKYEAKLDKVRPKARRLHNLRDRMRSAG